MRIRPFWPALPPPALPQINIAASMHGTAGHPSQRRSCIRHRAIRQVRYGAREARSPATPAGAISRPRPRCGTACDKHFQVERTGQQPRQRCPHCSGRGRQSRDAGRQFNGSAFGSDESVLRGPSATVSTMKTGTSHILTPRTPPDRGPPPAQPLGLPRSPHHRGVPRCPPPLSVGHPRRSGTAGSDPPGRRVLLDGGNPYFDYLAASAFHPKASPRCCASSGRRPTSKEIRSPTWGATMDALGLGPAISRFIPSIVVDILLHTYPPVYPSIETTSD